MKRINRCDWIWLFALLLPVTLFAAPMAHTWGTPLKLQLNRDFVTVHLKWSPDSRFLIVSGTDDSGTDDSGTDDSGTDDKPGVVQFWNVTTSSPRRHILWQGHLPSNLDPLFSPNHRVLAWESLGEVFSTTLFDISENKKLGTLTGKHPIFTDKGDIVTVKESNGFLEIRAYRIGRKAPLWSTIVKPPANSFFAAHSESINLPDTGPTPELWSGWAWAISPDGSRGAVLVWKRINDSPRAARTGVLIFETKTGKILRQLPARGAANWGTGTETGKAAVGGLEFTRDSRYLLVSGSMQNGSYPTPNAPAYKQIWDTYTGRLTARFHYQSPKPHAPNGTTVTANWRGKDGRRYKIRGLNHYSFSPNRRWLLTEKTGGILTLWDTQSGKSLSSLFNPKTQSFSNTYAFSPDSKKLAVHSGGQTLFLYRSR